MIRSVLVSLVLAAGAAAGCAHTDQYVAPQEPAPATADADRSAAAFKRIAGLAGYWAGEFGDPAKPQMGTVDYRVTSGGSTVEEVLARGKPHEMVTMYHLDKGRLLLTHYCAAGNQPTMVLTPAGDANDLQFEFLRGTNMAPTDGHMHAVRFQFTGDDRVVESWTYWSEGKAGESMVFDFRRTK